ncbi:MAG: replication-associated recombination protein A [Chitinophagales bacterium]|nr:replication-associated recombination protein A [Chitinophagales bacterium]
MQIPLAERVRPTNINQVKGQDHLLAKGKPLFNMVANKHLQSMIFWGPPGVGKTTLAYLLAQQANLPYEQLSAIAAGVKDLRQIIDKAQQNGTIVLFIDEIHRFNKSQQDALLGAVEKGLIILIGATTENPSFEVNSALLSRCLVFTLKALDKADLIDIVQNALQQDELLKSKNITIAEYDALLYFSGGDARKLLNILDLVLEQSIDKDLITNDIVEEIIQQNIARYDKSGEQHYDIISAFIKSMRGSDPNAAIYWLARMIVGGEDPKFIARRMLIFASEDIGNANPNALLLAEACFSAVEKVGYPECRIILSQTVIYLATSVKSNASYIAINDAIDLAKKTQHLSVPLSIRNAPTQLMKNLNYGKDYKYAHQFENNFVDMEFLPDEIVGTTLYQPGKNPKEMALLEFLKQRWKKYKY